MTQKSDFSSLPSQASSPLKIAIIGRIGSGKTALGTYLSGRGFPVLNLDAEVNELYKKNAVLRKQIGETFGVGVIAGGDVNHAALAKIVFSNIKELERLETLVYPLLFSEVREKIRNISRLRPLLRAIFIEGAVLNKCPKFLKELSRVWVVDAAEDVRRKRLKQRGLSAKDVNLRMELQENYPIPEGLPVLTIQNDGTLNDLQRETEKILESL
ncbi:MAG: dephospho-CoA kinase [Fibrobacter sp.]|jgi:dephospho-CoA kinase|nr:dephospho-CoA kinase [Fibrobacter sp.]